MDSIITILLVIFIVLKLTGNILWSWWWVLSPYWLPCAAIAVVVAIAAFVFMIAICIELLYKKIFNRIQKKRKIK